MWRTPPPLLLFFACYVGLGPPTGGLIAFLMMPFDGGLGPDAPSDVATIMLWGSYLIGLLPALITGATAALMWRIRATPLPYLALCCCVGAVSAVVIITPLVLLGTIDTHRELPKLIVFMAICGFGAALPPSLATLPAPRAREG